MIQFQFYKSVIHAFRAYGYSCINDSYCMPIFCRLEFDLAMQSNDLKRALQCLLTMSNSRDLGQDTGLELNDILNLTAKKENMVEAVQGIVKFAKEFLDLIDAADATGQAEIAREALKRLAAAGSIKGALQGHEIRGLALRLANHGELTRLSVCYHIHLLAYYFFFLFFFFFPPMQKHLTHCL